MLVNSRILAWASKALPLQRLPNYDVSSCGSAKLAFASLSNDSHDLGMSTPFSLSFFSDSLSGPVARKHYDSITALTRSRPKVHRTSCEVLSVCGVSNASAASGAGAACGKLSNTCMAQT